MELNKMKIQFSFKETKQFCSQHNLGRKAITSTYLGYNAISLNIWTKMQRPQLIWAIVQLTTTFGLFCKYLNFWGHFVKTQKFTTLCNYN